MSPVIDVVGKQHKRGCLVAERTKSLFGLINGLLSQFLGLFNTKERRIGCFSPRFVSTGRFAKNLGS